MHIVYSIYMGKSTTIRIDVSTKNAINKFGEFGETYDDIIRRLIKHYKPER